jgi:hypothetical protein
MGYYQIKLDANSEKLKIQIQTLTHGYQDCTVPDVFQNVMSKRVQDMEYVKTTILS